MLICTLKNDHILLEPISDQRDYVFICNSKLVRLMSYYPDKKIKVNTEY